MPTHVPSKPRRQNVHVKKMALPLRTSAQTPSSRLEEIISASERVEELSDSEGEYEDMGAATIEEQANIAYLDSVTIPIRDSLETGTSKLQDDTLEVVLPFLEGNPHGFPLNSCGLPKLQRQSHINMLKMGLGDYPAPFAAMDASRPWIVYWGLQGLSALGYDISNYQKQYVKPKSGAQCSRSSINLQSEIFSSSTRTTHLILSQNSAHILPSATPRRWFRGRLRPIPPSRMYIRCRSFPRHGRWHGHLRDY